jgi:formylglycine-generating enzyme required for sulfatase activity
MVLVPGGIDRSPRYVADGPFGGTLAEGGVAVPDLCFDVTEVTVDAFRACHAAGRCCEPDTGPFCNWGAADRSGHPVNCVDRRQAQQYCEFAGRHLPSTDEWVWAATGGARGWIWPWGDERVDDTRVCWKRRDFETGGGEGTCLPGSRPAGRSPEGIEDLSGNVKEWTSSPFASNPKGPDASVRGGAWENDPEHSNTRSRSEFRYDPDLRVAEVGFRCVAEPGTKPGS